MSEENLNEELDDLITLTDEDGEEISFEFIDLIEYKGKEYVVLLPEIEDEDETSENNGSIQIKFNNI